MKSFRYLLAPVLLVALSGACAEGSPVEEEYPGVAGSGAADAGDGAAGQAAGGSKDGGAGGATGTGGSDASAGGTSAGGAAGSAGSATGGSGGASGAAGSAGKGGGAGAGGASNGGSAGAGGLVVNTGGSAGKGGSAGTGGSSGTGGASTGGSAGAGGSNTGGSAGAGGSNTGGSAGTGGSNTGGSAGTGGSSTGGSAGAGGVVNTGGSAGTGGAGTGGTTGTGGAPCVPPVSGTCDTLPQCGCLPAENCDVYSAAGETTCVTAGQVPPYHNCANVGDCQVGYTCVSGVCKPFCDSTTDCPGSSYRACDQVYSGDTPIPQFKVCTQQCNPRAPLQNTGAWSACGTNTLCVATPSGSSDCIGPAGTGVQNTACTLDTDCSQGFACVPVDVGDVRCLRWCTKDSECPGYYESCYFFNTPLFAGTTEYGVCFDPYY